MRIAILAPLLALLPAAARAEPMNFEGALENATRQAASLRAGTLSLEAEQAAAIAAAQLPDPKVGLALENFPISGPPAFTFSGDNMTMARVGVSQEVPNLAKRHARTSRAAADIGAAQASLSATARQVRVATALAWIDLSYADRRVAAIDAAIGKVASYRSTSAASLASGSARPAEALEVQKAVAALEDKRAELIAERAKARSTLTRWTGDPDPQAVGSLPSFALDPQALETAIEQHPDIAVANSKVAQAEADIDLARADKRPDWMFDVAYQRRSERFGDMVSAGVTVSLPLFARKRQDPLIAARLAASGAARAAQEDERRSLRAGLQSGLAEHEMHHEQWERARTILVPLARQQSELETASYAAGRARLVDVIAARGALADVELLALEREAAVARDAAELALTYGAPAP